MKHSLIGRTGLTLGAILLLAIVNMLVSFLTADSVENDAVRINLAGSLRMQSYRITEALLIKNDTALNPQGADLLQQRFSEFEERFYRPVLSSHIQNTQQIELTNTLDKLERDWLALKGLLGGAEAAEPIMLAKVDEFVALIDELVGKLERQTESKFRLLRILQGVSLLITMVIVVIGFVSINNNVVAPLKRILSMTGKVQAGDFSDRLAVEGDDELSQVAGTLNDMSESLDQMYRDLEQKVQEKTLKLEQARDGLAMLYESSRILSGEGSVIERIERSLVCVNLYFTQATVLVNMTRDGDQLLQLSASNITDLQNEDYNDTCEQVFTLGRQQKNYGELVAYSGEALSDQQLALLQAVSDTMATALNADWQYDHQHRLMLMEERAVIARELHDSLAQSLSYLKIQISRMQMLRDRGDECEELDRTIVHIKAGIDEAYRQLRELLATFRLQLPTDSLYGALEKTILEFSEQRALSIALEYQLHDCVLAPNEEIHILQIVRESLSNVIRHSGAEQASVSIWADHSGNVDVCVSDEGCGFSNSQLEGNHYGKIIMGERAKTLGGSVSFDNAASGGAVVRLRFLAESSRRETSGSSTIDRERLA